jgi:hypothetical protein
METTGFLQSEPGNNSGTRLASMIIIIIALIDVQVVLYFGRENIMLACTAAGTLFGAMAGPTMIWMYMKKGQEITGKGESAPANDLNNPKI